MTEIQSIRDELDIQRVVADYAWACDNGDWAKLRSVFSEDARLDYSSTGGPADDRDTVVAWLEQGLGSLDWIHHVVSNFQIELDGDRATVRALFHCTAKLPGAEDPIVTGGYYDEEFVRTAEGWKIRNLYEDNRWMVNTQVPEAAVGQQ